MNDDGNLALFPELIERSFGTGPEGLPGPAHRLAEGRRALRRQRRIRAAGASLAVVVAVGTGMALSGVGGEHAADGPTPPLATSGTSPTAAPRPSADRQAALDRLAEKARQQAHRIEQRQVSSAFPVSYGPDGQLLVKDGWEITQRVEEPMGLQPPEASLGLVATDGEHTRWLLITHEHAVDAQGNPLPNAFGDSGSADDPGKGYSRFEDWLASMVDLQGGAQTQPLVVVGGDDRLEPGPGADVVAVQALPVVDGYSTAGDRMAEVRRDGRTWFVAIRGHGQDAEVIPVDAAVLSAPTFEAFVDHVRDQAGSGEGLR